MPSTTPTIERLEWGSVHTSVGTFRDARLWPGGGRDWDWRETGTHHSPGVQVADLAQLLDHAVEVVVIGCGQRRRLGVTDAARQAVADAGASLEVLESSAAVARHNELVDEDVAVATLVHSTC